MSDSSSEEATDLAVALKFANRTHDVIFRRSGDPNILSYVHTVLVFIYQSTFSEEAMAYLAPEFPWKPMSLMLNTLFKDPTYNFIESEDFPHPEGPPRPLPEDYAMRGLLWAEKYYPSGWFSNDNIEDDEKGLEAAFMGEERKIRVLYLGCRIARENKWLRYDSKTRQFSVSPEFDIKPTGSIDLGDLPDATGRDGVLSDVPNSGGFDCEKGGFGEKRDFGENGCFGEKGDFNCEKGGFGEKGGFDCEKGGFGEKGGFVRRRLFLVLFVLFFLILLLVNRLEV